MNKSDLNLLMLIIFFTIVMTINFKNEKLIRNTINKVLSTKTVELKIKQKEIHMLLSTIIVIFMLLISLYYLNRDELHKLILNKNFINKLMTMISITTVSFLLIFLIVFLVYRKTLIENMNIEGFVNYLGTKKMNKVIKSLEDNDIIAYKPNIKTSPECCENNDSYSTGCMCVDADDIEFIRSRGGNQ